MLDVDLRTESAMSHVCPACAGKRIVTVMVENMKGPSGNRYQSSITPYKPINRQCSACRGTGQVDCRLCFDTGEVATADMYGDFDTIEYCTCAAGRELELSELEATIERVSHEAADAVHAEHAAHLAEQAAIEYGPEDLAEMPF